MNDNKLVRQTITHLPGIDIKRFYLNSDTFIQTRCPKCNEQVQKNIGNTSYYYPLVGEQIEVNVTCTCGHEFSKIMRITDISLTFEYEI